MLERLCCPVDVYMVLERDGRLLMLRRAAGAAYAPLLLCPPSGHVEQGEGVAAAAARETAEETGIRLRPEQVRVRDSGAALGARRAGADRVVLRRQARVGRGAGKPGARQALRTGVGRPGYALK